jgi:phage tail sheath protein FI
MSVKKFKFVSPGVFLNEIDNSQLPAQDVGIGPVIIGRTRFGPGMEPITVRSPAEFVEVFGNPIPGGGGPEGDVWREGNLIGPTYASYAGLAYLNAGVGPVTMVRLLGEANDAAADTDAASAGWKCSGTLSPAAPPTTNGGSYGLYLFQSSSGGAHTGSLAATIYCNAGALTLTGTTAGGSTEEGTCALFNSIGTYGESKLQIRNTAGDVVYTTAFNLDRDSDKYIRNVLNTNPILTNEELTEFSNLKKGEQYYWLGETFERDVGEVVKNLSDPTGVFAMLVAQEASGSTSIQRDYMQLSAEPSETGWFFSQDLGTVATDYNALDMQRLFKFVCLHEGTWAQENLKISIQDIKASTDKINKFGSFTVLVRRASDSDKKVSVVERFSNVNLNPNSEDYIARRIGTKYKDFDYSESRLRTKGEFINRSKYIRVVMNQLVDQGSTDPRYLPFGTFGPLKLEPLSGVSYASASSGVVPEDAFFQGAAAIPSAVTPNDGELALPADVILKMQAPSLAVRVSASAGGLTDQKDAFFGLDNAVSPGSDRWDEGYGDYLRANPEGVARVDSNQQTSHAAWTSDDETKWTSWQYVVSLDDVIVQGVSDSEVFWQSGSRALGTSKTATGGTWKGILDAGYDRITTALYGGIDGFDVTEADPVRNSLITAGATETSNYVYNTIKRAIDTVADPEVVESNVIMMPGLTNASLTQHLIDTCEERADSLAIIDLPNVYTPPTEGKTYLPFSSRLGSVSEAVTALENRVINSSYACTYYPWVQVRDTISGQLLWVPPSVVALGTFASSEAKSQVWFAPAGFNRGGLTEGSAGLPVLAASEKVRSKDRDTLYEANINPIAEFPSEGIVIFGQKTLQVTQSALDRINVRRLLIYIKKEISKIANNILFDQNVKVTWSRFTGPANRFLSNVQSGGGLTDFKVILDKTTTTPDLVDRNIVYAKIFLKPARAIEYIAVDFNITRTGASFDD